MLGHGLTIARRESDANCVAIAFSLSRRLMPVLLSAQATYDFTLARRLKLEASSQLPVALRVCLASDN